MQLVVLAAPHALDEHTPKLALKRSLVVASRPILVVTVAIARCVAAMGTHDTPSLVGTASWLTKVYQAAFSIGWSFANNDDKTPAVGNAPPRPST